jgi:alanyl-tRNA synthetase
MVEFHGLLGSSPEAHLSLYIKYSPIVGFEYFLLVVLILKLKLLTLYNNLDGPPNQTIFKILFLIKIMDRKELIKKYIEFFKSKDHKEIQNASLIPENDPTTLFIGSGVETLIPNILGQPHPLGKKLVNVQKCLRTGDIEEVGDNCHHTFFEMLGNWSLGDYWKKDAIKISFELATKILKIPIKELSVTCFKGDKNAEKDEESAKIWKSLGINKIKFLGKEHNWWGPVGKTGPCGPDTELFINDIEIWNDVFLQYNKTKLKKYEELKQKNVDNGRGLERILALLNNNGDSYLTDVWQPIIKEIEKLSKKLYKDNKKEMRIIADHIKAATIILAEGITPSNSEQGYVLRRLIRRAVRYGKLLKLENFTTKVAQPVFEIYDDYEHLQKNKKTILQELEKEEIKFKRTLEKGLNKFNKFTKDKKQLSGKQAFLLYQSFGFPIEMIQEESKKNKIKFNEKDFEKEQKKHQKLSQTASAGKFKSGLADHTEQTTKLHTAAHLLLAALIKVLDDKNIKQRGSNINPERLRLDFEFPRKLTPEEIKEIENLVNKQIKKEIKITRKEMSPEEAKKQGAQGIFTHKYGDIVSVYTIGNFSKEICTGPHVNSTKELGKFKIIKETSSSSGVRRIKAIVK